METNEQKLLNFISAFGTMMIKNGAETQRTEQSIMRIAESDGLHRAEVFAVPTSVMITLHNKNGTTLSEITRAYCRRINLEKVIACDNLANRYISGEETLDRCILELEEIDKLTDFKLHVRILSYGFISFAFTILFRGVVTDSFIAFLAGVFQGIVMEYLGRYNLSAFLSNAAGSAAAAAVAYIFYAFGIAQSYNSIILGSLMPLVPGFAITNAVRDLLYGDYISGSAKVLEVIVTAVGIAAGVLCTLMVLEYFL